MNIQNLVLELPPLLGLLGSMFFVYKYKHFSSLGYIIGWFIVFTTVCEMYARYTVVMQGSNLIGLHIYTLGQFIFCSFFFYHLFKLLKWEYFKIWYIYIGIGLIIFNSVFIQKIEIFNSYSKTAVQFIFIILCFMGYFLLTLKEYDHWDKSAVKIIISAILLSSAASLTLYLFSNQIMTLEQSMQRKIWMINVGCNILVQVLYIYALAMMVIVKKRFDLEK